MLGRAVLRSGMGRDGFCDGLRRDERKGLDDASSLSLKSGIVIRTM
jgi:hypothetical protein